MLPTTIEATKAIFKADPSLTPAERTRIVALLLNSGANTPTPKDAIPRLLKRDEVARRLGCTPRTVDNLAASGALPRVKLPGRSRSVGFRESDVTALIEGR